MSYGFLSGYRMQAASRQAVEAGAEAEAAGNRAERAAQRLEDMLARHALVLKTLLSFCEKRGLFNEPEFLRMMEEVDLSDGIRDGRYKPGAEPKRCAACGRANQRTAIRCMYCGEDIPDRAII
ncbi:MAG: hypothetical protein HUU03_06150 [Planctomycetaceae bacterium]|mgnify:CR=1 FL=1|nr:hypothetical protein [Planctomycetota bacterium]MCQ3949710.1 hypothetical protein [Planctomycetota bacterium]NUO16006.1 hypothetical protein [Planctomycetaceae bacterium]GIK53363.1 MAG: hypothetical protein BroJett014_23360 [Planctomycetota bacterium]HRJ79193.1 hypothetical protein [Planctomycetota bacterium]